MSYSRWETPSELTQSTLAKHDFRRFVGGAYGVLAGQTIGFDNFLDLVCAGEAYETYKNTAMLKEALAKYLPGATWAIHQGEPELSTENDQAAIVSSPGREYLIQINSPFCQHPIMVTKHITRFSDGSGDLSTLWVYNLQDSVLNILKTAQAITDAYQDCFKSVRQINIYRGDPIPLPPHTWADWDTVFVSPEVAANVKDDIQFFLNHKEEFAKVGIPYKRGYLLHGPPGCGKCLGVDTPILMFDGTVKKVQDVKVGDLVMGHDSQPRTVTSLARGQEEMYKVTPIKGDPYIVNKSHILSLKYSGHKGGKYKHHQITDISVSEYLSLPKHVKARMKGFRSGVDFTPHAELPLDPYFMGLWLGDGHSHRAVITTADSEILDYITNLAHSKGLKIRPQGKYSYHLSRGHIHQDVPNPIHAILKGYGVLGNKHIPHDYKTASREDRLRLLAGLIDSDGAHNRNTYDYTTISDKLADGVVFVARSLGFSAYKHESWKLATNAKNPTKARYWRITISGSTDEIPCQLPRKKCRKRTQIKDVLVTGIKVTPQGVGDYYGFELAEDDRHFLLGDFTVTHNTTLARVIATSMPFASFAFDFSNPKMTNQDLTAAFAWAAKSAPAVFFMEDIDRIWASDSNKRSLVTLDHLLNCIDGIATNDGLIVFASANCPEKIDPAIINRPGRFDQVVKVDLPDYDLRLRYLTWLFRLTPASVETLEWVAEQTQGVSMAHLKEIFVVSMKNYVMSKKDNGDDHELSIRNAVSRVLEMFGGVSSKNTRRAGFGT